MHRHRFIVLGLATLFFVFEPISSTNNTTNSPPTTTAIKPTPTTTSILNTTSPKSNETTTTRSSSTTTAPKTTSSTSNTTTSSTSLPTGASANSTSQTSTTTTSSTSSTNAASTSSTSQTSTTTTSSTATATTPSPKPTSSSSVNFTINATTTTPPVVRPSTSVPETKSISMKITFDIPFKKGYSDKESKEHKELKTKFTKVLEKPLSKKKGFLRVEILSFREGSVVCDFNVIFEETASTNAEDVKETLQEASKSGRLGGYTVTKIEIVDGPTPTPSSNEFWDKVIMDYLGGTLISFIVMVAAVGLCLILLIALICTCHHYRKLKKKTQFPKDVIINNDSAWINSNDNLLMWERNLRATEVNPGNPPNRPTNEKRP